MDRHKTRPLSIRLPDALRVWVLEKSETTGRPVRGVILDALEAARERDAGGGWPARVAELAGAADGAVRANAAILARAEDRLTGTALLRHLVHGQAGHAGEIVPITGDQAASDGG